MAVLLGGDGFVVARFRSYDFFPGTATRIVDNVCAEGGVRWLVCAGAIDWTDGGWEELLFSSTGEAGGERGITNKFGGFEA